MMLSQRPKICAGSHALAPVPRTTLLKGCRSADRHHWAMCVKMSCKVLACSLPRSTQVTVRYHCHASSSNNDETHSSGVGLE